MENNMTIAINILLTLGNALFLVFTYRYKQKIRAEFDIQIERMKIQYSTLYQKRTQTIENIYTKICEIQELINDTLNAHSEDELFDKAENFDVEKLYKLTHNLTLFYNSKRIYLNKTTYEKLQKFTDSLFIEINKYEAAAQNNPQFNPREEFSLNLPSGIWNDILETIIEDFQQLIGTSSEST